MKLLDDAENAAAKALGLVEVLIGGRLYLVTEYKAVVDEGRLMRGSVQDAAGLAQLYEQGIRQVVNLCAEHDESEEVFAAGMVPVWIPIIDNTCPTPEQAAEFLAVVARGTSTYVHCEAGKGRTGTAVALYRWKVQGWTPEKALHEAALLGLAVPCQRDWILALR